MPTGKGGVVSPALLVQQRRMDASMIAQTKALEDENRRLKKMFAELSMQNELLKEALGKK